MERMCTNGAAPPSLATWLCGGLLCALGALNLLLGSAVGPRHSVAGSAAALCGLVACVAATLAPASDWARSAAVWAACVCGAAVGYRHWLRVLDGLQLLAFFVACVATGPGSVTPGEWGGLSAGLLFTVALSAVFTGGASVLLGLVLVCPYSAIAASMMACGLGVVAQLVGCALRECGRRRGAEAQPLTVNQQL